MCAVRRRSPPAPKPIRQRICVHEAEPFEGETSHRHRGSIDDVMQRNRRTIVAAIAMCSSTPIVAREDSFEIERSSVASATVDFYVKDKPFAADRIASATNARTTKRERQRSPTVIELRPSPAPCRQRFRRSLRDRGQYGALHDLRQQLQRSQNVDDTLLRARIRAACAVVE